MVKYLVSALNINLFLRIGTAKSSEKIFSTQESQGKIFFFLNHDSYLEGNWK